MRWRIVRVCTGCWQTTGSAPLEGGNVEIEWPGCQCLATMQVILLLMSCDDREMLELLTFSDRWVRLEMMQKESRLRLLFFDADNRQKLQRTTDQIGDIQFLEGVCRISFWKA